jgi:hypothetical protein
LPELNLPKNQRGGDYPTGGGLFDRENQGQFSSFMQNNNKENNGLNNSSLVTYQNSRFPTKEGNPNQLL